MCMRVGMGEGEARSAGWGFYSFINFLPFIHATVFKQVQDSQPPPLFRVAPEAYGGSQARGELHQLSQTTKFLGSLPAVSEKERYPRSF